MKHIRALGIKFVFTATILLVLFLVYINTNTWEILLISLLVTAVSYVLGDLFILPKLGHLIAAISDFLLGFLAIWFFGWLFLSSVDGLILTSAVAAMVLTFCEGLFHSHMSNHVVHVKGTKSPEQREKDENRKEEKGTKVTNIKDKQDREM